MAGFPANYVGENSGVVVNGVLGSIFELGNMQALADLIIRILVLMLDNRGRCWGRRDKKSLRHGLHLTEWCSDTKIRMRFIIITNRLIFVLATL